METPNSKKCDSCSLNIDNECVHKHMKINRINKEDSDKCLVSGLYIDTTLIESAKKQHKKWKEREDEKKKAPKIHFKQEENITNIGIIENMMFSIESVQKCIKELSEDVNNLMQYKMLVLSVDNFVELLFKYIISKREEILLYSDEDMKKVLNKYRTAYTKGFIRLQSYFASYPETNDLHTISFSKACDLVESYYHIISEEFAWKCQKIARIRNGFIHYSATIKHADVITVLYVYEECKTIFMNETETEMLNIQEMIDQEVFDNINKTRNCLYFNNDILHINKIIFDIFKEELIEKNMFWNILGFVVEKYTSELIDITVKDVDFVEKIFFKEYSIYYEGDMKKWHIEFCEMYRLMYEAGIIYEDTEIYDDKLSTIWVRQDVLDYIDKEFSEQEQRDKMRSSKSISKILSEWREVYEDYYE